MTFGAAPDEAVVLCWRSVAPKPLRKAKRCAAAHDPMLRPNATGTHADTVLV